MSTFEQLQQAAERRNLTITTHEVADGSVGVHVVVDSPPVTTVESALAGRGAVRAVACIVASDDHLDEAAQALLSALDATLPPPLPEASDPARLQAGVCEACDAAVLYETRTGPILPFRCPACAFDARFTAEFGITLALSQALSRIKAVMARAPEDVAQEVAPILADITRAGRELHLADG